MIIKRLWLALLALVLLTGCASTQGGINALSPTPAPENTVAQITYRDGSVENISQNELDAFSQRIAQLSGQGTPPPPAFALDSLVSRKLMLHLARTTDTQASPEEIEQVVTNLTMQGPGGQSFCPPRPEGTTGDNRTYFDECAQVYGFDGGTDFRNFIAEELTIDKVTRQEAPKDLIRTAHILTEDYETAATAYDRVMRNPGQFGEVAREVSVDPGSRDQGGELPPFNEQGFTETQQGQQPQQFNTTFVSNTLQLRPEFERTGEAISQPFEVQTEQYSGWHIVRILGLEASGQSANDFRTAVLDRALNAQPSDLVNDPDTGDVPLVGAVQILRPFPTPEALPTPEVLPEITTPTPEGEPILPEEGTTTAEPDETAPAEGAPVEQETTTATP